MLCQYLAVFGRNDDERERRDEDAICSGQKLKGGRAGVAGGAGAVRRKGRDGRRGQIDRVQYEGRDRGGETTGAEEDELSTG